MNRNALLTGLFFLCVMIMCPPSVYSNGCGPETTTTTNDLPEQATVPNTQSTANMDTMSSGVPNDPMAAGPLGDIGTAERDAREAQLRETSDWIKENIEDLRSRSSSSPFAKSLVDFFEAPQHSNNFMGQVQTTDTISAPPAKGPASTKTEYLGGGFYGDVLPAGAAGKSAAKNESAAFDKTAGAAGDMIKMQDTSKAGPPPSPPLPKDTKEFAEYLDSIAPSDHRDINKAFPPTQKGAPDNATPASGKSGASGGAKGDDFGPDLITH